MKLLVIVGAAACVSEDLDRVPLADVDVAAVNSAILLPDVLRSAKHWISYHPLQFAETEAKAPPGALIDVQKHSHLAAPALVGAQVRPPQDVVPGVRYWDFSEGNAHRTGGSALLAVLVGLALGYEGIVLAGCPLSSDARYDKPVAPGHYDGYRLGWQDRLEEIRGKVTSLSGWTQGLLGSPTADWIEATRVMEEGDDVVRG